MSRIKIGWATRNITTDEPCVITGQAFVRIKQGAIDPVTTTALVMDSGNDAVIFVSMDHVGIRCGLVDEVRAKAKALCPDIPAEKIIMNVTHAHTGVSFYHDERLYAASDAPEDRMPMGGVTVASGDKLRDWLSTTQAEMIAEAWNGRKEGGYAYGYGYAVVGHSRRVCYFDDVSKREGNANSATNTFAVNGTSVMYGNTNDDNFSHFEAGDDPFINLLYTFDADNKLTGAIINIPCPSQCSEHEWHLTGDYWHDVRVALRRKYGEDFFILPQCAAAGDLSPRVLHYNKAQERRFYLKYGNPLGDPAARSSESRFCIRKDIAERVAEAFDEVLSWAKKDIRTESDIEHRVSTIQLSKRIVTDEEYQASVDGLKAVRALPWKTDGDPIENFKENTKLISNRKRHLNVIRNYETQKEHPDMPMELHVLRLGDIAFATNRFELFMDYQHRIQARSPFEQTFIVQLCGQPGEEGGSYLCTERAEKGKGYSAILYSVTASPKGGQQLVEATVKQLKELYNK